jgi:uncharacterized protein YggE
MRQTFIAALLLGAAAIPARAAAQSAAPITQSITGTRLDISATGEVTRVPDIAIITAGVATRSTSASGALQEAATRMQRVHAALKAAGIADRDIQTSNINLNPEYVYENNQPPRLNGYSASNQVTVRFRDIANAGKILDALVAQGANSINGPNLTIDHPEAALDEARAKAVAIGRARADLYARSLGLRVTRIVAVSEGGGNFQPPPPMPMILSGMRAKAETSVEAGEQNLQATLAMTFELQ